MTQNEALERRLGEMFDGHAWHGPPALATLRDLTPAQLAESDAAIRAAVMASDTERLDPGSDQFDERLYRNVLGAISHLAWHAGQIAILRRSQGLEPAAPEA